MAVNICSMYSSTILRLPFLDFPNSGNIPCGKASRGVWWSGKAKGRLWFVEQSARGMHILDVEEVTSISDL